MAEHFDPGDVAGRPVMTEQSGGGPITREQVERAIDDARADRANSNSGLLPMSGNLGENWRGLVPDYVNAAWSEWGWDATIAALTRWRDELAAAEPVRRVARWVESTQDYRLSTPHVVEVGDLGPVLREVAQRTIVALQALQDDGPVPARPPKMQELPGYAEWRDNPIARVANATWIAQLEALLAVPASPPAPEVVDVPQPIVKRCACPDVHDDVEAEWRPGEPYLTVTHTTVPLALLRAMLEAIDAQQGGAS